VDQPIWPARSEPPGDAITPRPSPAPAQAAGRPAPARLDPRRGLSLRLKGAVFPPRFCVLAERRTTDACHSRAARAPLARRSQAAPPRWVVRFLSVCVFFWGGCRVAHAARAPRPRATARPQPSRWPRRSPPRAGPRGAGRWRAPARLRRALAPWRHLAAHASRASVSFPRRTPPRHAARSTPCRALSVAVVSGRAPAPPPRPAGPAPPTPAQETQEPGQRPPHEEARTGPTDPPSCGALAPALWSPGRRRVRGAPRAAPPSPRRRPGSRRAYAGAPPAGGSVVPVLAGGARCPGSCWGAGVGGAGPAGRGGGAGIVARGAVPQVRRGAQVQGLLCCPVRVLPLLGLLVSVLVLVFLVVFPPQLGWRLKGWEVLSIV